MKPAIATALLVMSAAAAYAANQFAGPGPIEESKVTVCVARDRVLRLMDPLVAGCAAGERRIDLRRWSPELTEAEERQQDAPKKPDERHVSEGASHRIVAPFEVVDESGSVIFRVVDDDDGHQRGAYIERDGAMKIGLAATDVSTWIHVAKAEGDTPGAMLTSSAEGTTLDFFGQGGEVLELGEREQSGFVHAFGASGPAGPAALLDVFPDSGNLILAGDGGQPRIVLGPGSQSNPALRIFEGDDVAAAIGIDTFGEGAVRVAYKNNVMADLTATVKDGGRLRVFQSGGGLAAAVAGKDGFGTVQVLGEDGVIQGSLTRGANGGVLQLNSLSGEPMVEAGNNGNVGVVRAGPISRGTSAIPGLPGSYILGMRR